MNPYDTLCTAFNQLYDFSAIDVYNFIMYIGYVDDANSTNDTLTGFLEHYELIVDLGGTNDTITTTSYPYTLSVPCSSPLGVCYYIWSNSSTASTIDVNADGWYSVTVSDDNGCDVSDSVYVVLDTKIDNINNKFGVSIYPNPNNGQFILSINLANENNAVVEITNIEGQVLFNEQIKNSKTKEFDLRNFASGMYFIQIHSANKMNIHILYIIILKSFRNLRPVKFPGRNGKRPSFKLRHYLPQFTVHFLKSHAGHINSHYHVLYHYKSGHEQSDNNATKKN